MTYSSSFLTNASNAPLSRMPGYALVDSSIRLARDDDRWELALIGKNLTNQWVFVASPDVPFTNGDRFASIGRGRELMVRVGFKY